jgi:phosphatidylserine synthase
MDSHASGGSASSEVQKLPRTFGLKDVFTCINVLAGVGAIIFCIEGNLRLAAYSFLLGFILGDSLDGWVARKTNTSNKFGAEFDTVGDHFVQCVAPAFMVYAAYRPLSPYLGAVLAAALVISGSIRHARGAVVSANFPMAYIGMPRTVSSFVIISFLNSAFIPRIPGYLWFGVALVAFLCVANLLPIPFRSHKGRKLKPWVKYFIFAFFSMTIVALALLPQYVFDVTLLWLIAYSTTSWLEMEPEERREFFARARQWSAEVRAAR